MKSIKTQLIVLILILVVIATGITNLSYYYSTSGSMRSQVENNNQTVAKAVASNVESFVQKSYTLSEEIVNNSDIKSFIPEKQNSALLNSIGRNSYLELMYIQKPNGEQTAKSSGTLGSRADRWWFIQFMKDKKPFITKSYYSISNNSTVCSIIMPIYDDAKNLAGVFGADLKLNALQSLVEKSNTQEGSYTYIVDGEGVVIAHPKTEQVSQMYNYKTGKKTVLVKDSSGKAVLDAAGTQKTEAVDIKVTEKLKEITISALNGKSGNTEYTDNDNNKLMCVYSSISIPGQSDKWAVITVQDKAVALQPIKNIQYKNIIILTFVIALVVFVTIYVSKRFTKPIINIMTLMKRTSEGDLTVYSDYKSKDEIGALSTSFNTMIDHMKELINKIDEASNTVISSSSSLAEATDETVKSIEDIAQTITHVAEDAQSQAVGAAEGLEAANKLSSELEQMSTYIKQTMQSTNDAINSNNNGLKAIDVLEIKSQDNNEVIKKVGSVINSLNEKANTIGDIVETITSISEQTNLLALNAAIEAARAGESGKGFAVVAEEVRKLSEHTAEASNNVKNIINVIQKDISEANDTIIYANNVVAEQNNAVSNTGKTFKDIDIVVENIVSKINNISQGIENVIISRDSVLNVINKVSEISDNLSSSSEEVSAVTEEQSAAMHEMNKFAVELNSMAENLNNTIKVFKIK